MDIEQSKTTTGDRVSISLWTVSNWDHVQAAGWDDAFAICREHGYTNLVKGPNGRPKLHTITDGKQFYYAEVRVIGTAPSGDECFRPHGTKAFIVHLGPNEDAFIAEKIELTM